MFSDVFRGILRIMRRALVAAQRGFKLAREGTAKDVFLNLITVRHLRLLCEVNDG